MKAKVACVCTWVSPQKNNYPILVLQHPDERKKPLGTAKILTMGLEEATLLSGLDFSAELFHQTLRHFNCHKPILLYPKTFDTSPFHLNFDLSAPKTEKHNLDSVALSGRFDCVILLDGTWRNTRELLLLNTWIKDLPTLALQNVGESRYRIRKTKGQGELATIEAAAKLLSILEDDFSAEDLLRPFEWMIEYQISKMGLALYKRNYQ